MIKGIWGVGELAGPKNRGKGQRNNMERGVASKGSSKLLISFGS